MIKANDPCPCGSGKLHKDCCMKKDNVHELTSYRREQFYKEKQHLVEKIGFFLQSKIFHQDFMELKNMFVRRTSRLIQEDMEESFFVFWLFFYHRFDDGLRGLEWFKRVKGNELDGKELGMLDRWIELYPRFLQLVDIEGKTAIFEDVETKERLPFAIHKENIAHPVPWLATFAMVEEFDGLYYFNGFWMGVGPAALQQALATAESIKERTGMEQNEVVREFFPEITAALINQTWQYSDSEQRIYQSTISYVIKDEESVLAFLKNQGEFYVERWDESEKQLIWVGNWRKYYDSESPLPVKAADKYGTVTVKNNRMLIFKTTNRERVEKMKVRLAELGEVLKFNGDTKEAIDKQTRHSISIETDVPKCFQVHAEYDVFSEAERPIPMYNGLTLKQLEEQGDTENMETWLRNEEYIQYKRVQGRVGDVEVTANFNGIRESLGLPLSSFVTGGENRKTWFE